MRHSRLSFDQLAMTGLTYAKSFEPATNFPKLTEFHFDAGAAISFAFSAAITKEIGPISKINRQFTTW